MRAGISEAAQRIANHTGNALSLARLGLTAEELDELLPRIGDLTALTSLDLSVNGLAVLSERIGDLTALTDLDLSGNGLEVLSERIGDLTALTDLDLSGNGLEVLPERLWDLTALTSLDLSFNRLEVLPERIGDLTALTSLALSGNRLEVLPERIGDLTALTRLALSGNRLEVLPERLWDLTALTRLGLSGNGLEVLSERIGDLTGLTSLTLSGNRLEVLPERIGDLTGLTSLALSGNRLEVLPERLWDLTALTSLALSGNGLEVLPERIGDLTALTDLDLSGNGLEVLPERIGDLTALTELALSSNRLEVLPERIGDLTALTSLYLSGNRLAPEIAAAAEEGSESVLGFLRLLRVDGVDVSAAKLVFVGEGKVGKSSLLGALCGDPWVADRSQTHGMRIKTLPVAHDGNAITLNAWDFGGQAHYRPAHQVFFTAPAVYVVVWDPRIGPSGGMVEEWLAMIAHRAGAGARVHVVATHGGPASRADAINQAALLDRFGSMIVEFHDVDSSVQDDRLEALRAAISATAAGLPHVRRRYPASWLRVISALEAGGEQSLAYGDFEAVAADHGVAPVQARALASNAHALGMWVYYGDDPDLRDVVVLKPDWLSVAIARVLEDPQAVDDRGLVTHRHLGQLWARPYETTGPAYSHSQQQMFLRLMERFELTYRVPELAAGEPISLVAQLVPANEPDLTQVWESFRADRPEMVEICQPIEEGEDRDRVVVPEALMYRLIAHLHHQRLTPPGAPEGVHWRSGLLVQSRYGARALVTATPDGIRVAVRGPDPCTYLRQITEQILDCINGFWKGLATLALVPCRTGCGLNSPGRGLFDVAKLIEAQELGRTDADCPARRCAARVDIAALLHGNDVRPTPAQDAVTVLTAISAIEDRFDDLAREQRAGTGRVLDAMKDLSDDTQAALSRVDDAMRSFLRGLDDEAVDGPRLFTLVPLDTTWRRPGWTTTRMRLTLFCEHSRIPVHALDGDPVAGVYDLDVPRDWWVKTVPLLQLTVGVLKPLIGIGLADLELNLTDTQWDAIKEQVALAEAAAGATLDLAGAASVSDDGADLATHTDRAQRLVRAEGALLRSMHQLLAKKDPTNAFGDLRKVRDSQHRILWVHPTYLSVYQPGLPVIPTN